MKKSFVVFSLLFLLASCKSSNGPEPAEPAIMPTAPSEYTYAVVRPAFAGHGDVHLVERDSILSAANNIFDVVRRSDSIDGFFTTMDHDRYQVVAPGDLRVLGTDTACYCDSTALPIATHRSYDPSHGGIQTPTKKNGVIVIGSVTSHTQFDGMENVEAAGETFRCSKVEKRITIVASSGDPQSPVETTVITHIYWYSPAIQFFVKDQLLSDDSLSFTRTMMSYKLGK
ncbi:MAG: hypothetical protein Q8922_01560 [Bacteroidota bacterium]|nr:hypothetical protein [Bacteroidota bacterium]MDP4232086.1 hypothetical protein [Bacteroidota bacterium]MDP4241207.1 hypothetical protein [Bacteroidota bacterium]MDP4286599.1 hypothetical protein [Bacteroidota bacterium]